MLTFTEAIEDVGKAEKSTQHDANYRDRPKGEDHCADCTMFISPHGCTAVSGFIEPFGWCKFFEREIKKAGEFDESKHPRGEHGKFTETGGSADETKLETGYILGHARDVAKEQGFDPNKISVSTEQKTFSVAGTNYKTGGEAFFDKGNIVIYKPDLWTADGIKGVTAHEIMHQKYQAYQNDLGEETRKVMADPETGVGGKYAMRADGMLPPAGAEKYPLYQFHQTMYLNDSKGIDGWDRLKASDGVSPYSRDYWNAFEQKAPMGVMAYHETLSEIARLDYEGKLSQRGQLGHIENIVRKPNGFLTTQPLADEWGALYRAVNSNWRKNHWYKA